jgi:TolA-binding protein
MTIGDAQPAQPDPTYVIQAMSQELTRVNDNRMWLMSTLAQRDAQVAQLSAQISQLTSEIERLHAAAGE